MAEWSIESLTESDIPEFARIQFLAFVDNSLHDVVYPSLQTVEEDSHAKSLAELNKQPQETKLYG